MTSENRDGETETEAIMNDAADSEASAQTNLKESGGLPLDDIYQTSYSHVKKTNYRWLAIGLTVLGVVSAIGGVIFSAQRGMLFAFAATGLFGGVLAYSFANSRFVSAAASEHIYAAAAANEAAIASEFGSDHIYVPDETSQSARLVIPQTSDFEPPSDRKTTVLPDGDTQNLVLEPLGAGLFDEFNQALIADLASTPSPLAMQLTEGLVEYFELVRSTSTEINPTDGSVTVLITDSALGAVDRFDHPIASFLAVGFAAGLNRPIELEVAQNEDQGKWLVTCRWSGEFSS